MLKCGIRVSLKNVSDKEVILARRTFPPGFLLHSIELKKKVFENEMQKAYLTEVGFLLYSGRTGDPGHEYEPVKPLMPNVYLKPGEKAEIVNYNLKSLNQFYDISANNVYELTFYTRNYIGDNQVAEFPKPSKTIRFKIEGNDYWPDKYLGW
jgi:hypothetical protein